MIFNRQLPLLLIIFSLASCASWLPEAHRIDITQGNAIEKEALEKVQIGMKKSEITPIIGYPMLQDPFHAQRWDYIYRYVPGRGETVQSRLTLYFDGEVLIRIDDSEYREPVKINADEDHEPEPVEALPKPEVD